MKKIYLPWLILLAGLLFAVQADDGIKQKIKKIQMNINADNYLLFEEGNLVICSRENDSYLMEVDEEGNLYLSAKKVDISSEEQEYLRGYYNKMYEIYDLRNSMGSKGVRVGLAGARLAAKAVGHAVEYVFSGFDEEVEKKMECELEQEAEKLEESANGLEGQGERLRELVEETRRFVRKELLPAVPEIRGVNLELDPDSMPRVNISIDNDE
ncbi:MAG TPA: hypothetical protein ENJ15_06305 [Caldithrix abyssi]|uniref:DUF2884 family protein n=1 Tax=Caldithrix abyssi TaxID=187145 RepID=A0A7V5RPY7_CALAY|nr:hypothetical protein [Caldithrix abyssi]